MDAASLVIIFIVLVLLLGLVFAFGTWIVNKD